MDQDDEYYHNAKNRHEMYSLKEGDHVIGKCIIYMIDPFSCKLIHNFRCIEKIRNCICLFIYGHFGNVFSDERFSKVGHQNLSLITCES